MTEKSMDLKSTQKIPFNYRLPNLLWSFGSVKFFLMFGIVQLYFYVVSGLKFFCCCFINPVCSEIRMASFCLRTKSDASSQEQGYTLSDKVISKATRDTP